MSNPLYGLNPANPVSVNLPNYTAFAIEQVLRRDWIHQLTTATPVLAAIKDRDLSWRKGYEVNGSAALVPIIWDDLSAAVQTASGGFLTTNAGVTDANEIPGSWPVYDVTAGFSFASFDFTHMRRPLTLKSSEEVIGTGKGRATSVLDGKVMQLMAKFKSIMGDMIEGGNNNASRAYLLGLPYLLATNNVVGAIDQSTYSYWRASVQTAVGTLSLPVINNNYDSLNRNADMTGETAAPDLCMCAFNGSGVNVYGRFRELIAPAERIVNADFKAKYGFNNFQYLGMKVVMGNRMPTGTMNMLTTSTLFFGGYDSPKQLERIRIPGSDAYEYMYTLWAFLGCSEPRRNAVLKGITG